MARPHKMKVDYFPHYCAPNSRTLYILEKKYRNDGYAFWFKLLELLGTSEGHFYDYSKPEDWEFLIAKTCVDEVTANAIIKTLSDVDAIDKELVERKIIWSQNFVKNVADVYKRRQVPIPEKPYRQQIDDDDTRLDGGEES